MSAGGLSEAAERALGGGPERHREKAREQGKLGVRERVALLLDDGSFAEEALLANWEQDGLGADGVVGTLDDLAFSGNPPTNQTRIDAQTYVQYGLTDSLTVFGQTALEHYALGQPTPNTYNGLDYSGVGLRAKLWSTGDWVFSGEGTAFIPGARNSSAPAQEGNTGGAAEARLNVGRNFTLYGVPGFLDAEVAYRLRTGGDRLTVEVEDPAPAGGAARCVTPRSV